MSCDIQNSNPNFSGLYPQKGDPSPGNKIPYLLKPQRRSHSFEWRQEPRAQRCFYFCTAIFPAASCREQFNFLCRLISRSHFSSVSVTLLPSTRLKRVLLSLWTAFCSEEWGCNCTAASWAKSWRQSWACWGLYCLIFFLCRFCFLLTSSTCDWEFPMNSPGLNHSRQRCSGQQDVLFL